MKICLVSDNLVDYHDTWSGAEMIVQYLGSLLKKNGENITFLTIRSEKKEKPKDVFPVPALNSPIWFFKKIIPVHVIFRTIVVFFQLRKIKPDILHLFHCNSLFIPVMICAKILKIPATFTVLDYWIVCPTGHLLLENNNICQSGEGKTCLKCVSKARFLERWLVQKLTKDLKYLITFTETSKKRLIEHGFKSEKIKVKYIYEFKQGNQVKSGDSKDVLFIGTFLKQKGMHIIIEAMNKVVSQIPDAKLLIIGRGQGGDKERIEKLVAKLGIGDSVKFLGQKNNQETLEMISKSRLVVVAEQWFSDFGPVALVEAMALSKPVVAGDIGSAPDFIKDGNNGFLANYNNPEKFAEKIIWLLRNREEAVKIGQRAGETIKNIFGLDYNKEILELYTNL